MIRNLVTVRGANQHKNVPPSLSVSPVVIAPTAAYGFTTVTVTVASNDQDWDYEISAGDDTWIAVNDASKEGSDTCYIIYGTNPYDERAGSVTFTSNGCANVVVTVTQQGQSELL